MGLIVTYKKAFSLRDEIGKCPDIKVNMQKLVSLGILTKNSTTHTSPVMLVARKGNERKRPVVEFRLLYTRIVRRNTSTPLLRDIFIMLGRAQCEVLSCVNLKEAFHSLPLPQELRSFVAYSHILEAHTSGMEYYLGDLLQVPRSGLTILKISCVVWLTNKTI